MVSTGKGDGFAVIYMERCTIEMLDIKETLIQSQNQCFLNQRFPQCMRSSLMWGNGVSHFTNGEQSPINCK